MRFLAAVPWALMLVCVAVSPLHAQDSASADKPKTGEFEISFSERSPLSTPAELQKRLGEKAPLTDDYDLSKEPFRVYVPKNYDANVPHGIVYWLGYKDTVAAPPPWLPVLDRMHLIFISTVKASQVDWQRAGLTLDAPHNLKKSYKIDERRIYFFSYPQPPGTIPQRISFATPDVYTGFVFVNWFDYFRPLQIRGYQPYEAKFSAPSGPLFSLAKTRRFILASDPGSTPAPDKPDRIAMILNGYKQDGFGRIMRLSLGSREDAHYPNLTAPWFEEAMAFLDGPAGKDDVPAPVATTPDAPTTRPNPAVRPGTPLAPPVAASDAQKALTLARNYVNARSFATARTRLQEIITKYPNDPAAREAKLMLEQIKDK